MSVSGILSSISGQFSPSLVLGAFFPAAIFVILAHLLLIPFLPAGSTVLPLLEVLDPQWRVLALAFVTIVLTGLLVNLNIPIIQMFEGYPWEKTRIGRKRVERHQAQRKELETRRDEAVWLMDTLGEADPLHADVSREWTELCRRLVSEYPDEHSVLPTRLGNVMRASEQYPRRQYGMSAIPLWPRLIATIDKEYAAGIDEAKSSFDFMIHSTLLSTLLGALLLVCGLAYPTRLASLTVSSLWLFEILVLFGLARLLYGWSIGRASAWGSLVNGAFDLYRWKLLEQLGHTQRPTTRTAERDLWARLSRQVIFGDGDSGPRVRYADAPEKTPFASGEPWRARLAVARGVSEVDEAGVATIRLRVTNVDDRQRVTKIVVTDTPPDGTEYVWDSATVGSGRIRAEGAGPCRFHLLDVTLAPNDSIELGYLAIIRKLEKAYP